MFVTLVGIGGRIAADSCSYGYYVEVFASRDEERVSYDHEHQTTLFTVLSQHLYCQTLNDYDGLAKCQLPTLPTTLYPDGHDYYVQLTQEEQDLITAAVPRGSCENCASSCPDQRFLDEISEHQRMCGPACWCCKCLWWGLGNCKHSGCSAHNNGCRRRKLGETDETLAPCGLNTTVLQDLTEEFMKNYGDALTYLTENSNTFDFLKGDEMHFILNCD